MLKIIKKADIILFVVLIIFGFGLSWLSVAESITGSKAVITVDGKEYGVYSLSEPRTITIKSDDHINKITIKNGSVQMAYSDCKNQNCVNTGSISKTSQTIVCLPNKVMVEISSGEGDYDAISN